MPIKIVTDVGNKSQTYWNTLKKEKLNLFSTSATNFLLTYTTLTVLFTFVLRLTRHSHIYYFSQRGFMIKSKKFCLTNKKYKHDFVPMCNSQHYNIRQLKRN